MLRINRNICFVSYWAKKAKSSNLSWFAGNLSANSLPTNNRKQAGFSIVGILIVLVFLALLFLTLFIVIITGGGENTESEGTGIKQVEGESNNLPSSDKDSSNAPGSKPTNNLPDKYDKDEDLGSGYLKCVELNGVSFPRTPALDRRVRQIWLETKQDMDAQGIPPLRFTWGFRTYCQQVNVDSGGNTKAEPGTSPHEAGRALDVRDMTRRPDVPLIKAIFRKHGWHWAGPKDPPHFDIKGYDRRVGEPSHAAWIKKAQADFDRGGPREGCRGTKCGS